MQNKLIARMHNGLGNQMFIYATCYAFSKILNRELLIDDQSAFDGFNTKQNSKFSKYSLNIFFISAKIADKKFKFLNIYGYLKRKLLKKINNFLSKKKLYIESIESSTKLTIYKNNISEIKFSNIMYIEGHFETEKYFKLYEKEIKKEFVFKNENILKQNKFYEQINRCNSVSLCLRRDRFIERYKIHKNDNKDSQIFVSEQISYIKKSIALIKTLIPNPIFFLWSNNYDKLDEFFLNTGVTIVNNSNVEQDFYLMKSCKHFITVPSTFNWWAAWLSNNKDKIIIRPSKNNFSRYKFSNHFWPDEWIKI